MRWLMLKLLMSAMDRTELINYNELEISTRPDSTRRVFEALRAFRANRANMPTQVRVQAVNEVGARTVNGSTVLALSTAVSPHTSHHNRASKKVFTSNSIYFQSHLPHLFLYALHIIRRDRSLTFILAKSSR
jgi:hypothetical protein